MLTRTESIKILTTVGRQKHKQRQFGKNRLVREQWRENVKASTNTCARIGPRRPVLFPVAEMRSSLIFFCRRHVNPNYWRPVWRLHESHRWRLHFSMLIEPQTVSVKILQTYSSCLNFGLSRTELLDQATSTKLCSKKVRCVSRSSTQFFILASIFRASGTMANESSGKQPINFLTTAALRIFLILPTQLFLLSKTQEDTW